MKHVFSLPLLTIMLLFLTNSCEEPVNLPAVITEITVSEITATTAKSGGTVTDDKGEEILERGICWSTTINPTVKDSVTYNGVGVGAFISILTNLIPNSTYYLRAYATNKSGTAYGNEISFKTLADLATINTTPVNLITTTTAKSGGNIINDGNSTVIERGVCWSTTINPTVSNNKTEDGEGIGSYVSLITNLSPGTKYYVRAYAKNEIGISYGNNESFTTEIELPTVSTNSVSAVGLTMATVIGNVLNDGGGVVTDRGVCWGVNEDPTIDNSKKRSGNGNGIFTSQITELISNSTYYLRAYATNSAGTTYGNSIKFSTLFLGTVTDIDGNVYNTVTYGNQTWMVENLRTTKYRNGILINTSSPLSENQWAYQNNESNVSIYGRLYNYVAVKNNNQLAPDGWRIPSKADWETFINYLKINGFSSSASLNFLVSESLATNTYWNTSTISGSASSLQSANNTSGFSAVPGGWRLSNGNFIGLGFFGWWWTTTNYNTNDDYFFELRNDETYPKLRNITRAGGFSVRCIKN